eukprot:g16707.t1
MQTGKQLPAPPARAEAPFTCATCGDEFSRSHALQQHLRVHAGQRAFGEMSFTRAEAVSSREQCNRGERLAVCDVCGKGFTVAALLARHQVSHTGRQPHECGLCGKTFALAENCGRHRRLHLAETQSYRCDACSACFPQAQQLVLHQRSHGPRESFVCPACGKGFTQQLFLQWHMPVHAVSAMGAS